MKRYLTIIIIILSLSSLFLTNCGQKGNTIESEDSFRIPVEIATVERTTVLKEVKYTGDIRAEQEVKVFSKVPDRILSFEKDVGDYVAKGDVSQQV